MTGSGQQPDLNLRVDGWCEPRQLLGPTLRLMGLTTGDAADFLSALGQPSTAAEVLEFLAYDRPSDVAAAERLIQDARETPSRLPYGQRLLDSGEFVGTTSFYEIDPTQRSLAIGHTWIAKRFWRTRVNTESKLLMLCRAFDELGAERVVWHTDIRNGRSQTAIERLGAQREGVVRHHRIRRDGSWRDTVQFSMLSAEWPEAKARLVSALGMDPAAWSYASSPLEAD